MNVARAISSRSPGAAAGPVIGTCSDAAHGDGVVGAIDGGATGVRGTTTTTTGTGLVWTGTSTAARVLAATATATACALSARDAATVASAAVAGVVGPGGGVVGVTAVTTGLRRSGFRRATCAK